MAQQSDRRNFFVCSLKTVCLAGVSLPLWLSDAHAARKETSILELGRENWDHPWIPDLKNPTRALPIPLEKRVDVVLLGDGYLANESARFAQEARDWYTRFLTYTPYYQLRGMFRVRAVWSPSMTRCLPAGTGDTAYGLPVTVDGVDMKAWNSKRTRESVFAALDKLGVNPALRSGRFSHTFVGTLIRNANGKEPSGITRLLRSPDDKRAVRMAMGEHVIHEFTHAYADVGDEYIRFPDAAAKARKPAAPSLFTLSNLAYSRDPARIPWMHYAPGSALNPDPNSLIGLLWIGGSYEKNVWHCQAHCLMNGTHDNWDLAKTKRGANLRDFRHFCVWCQELIVAKTYQRAGLLGDDTDGAALWQKWVTDFRPDYLITYKVPDRIRELNAADARSNLAASKLYERPLKPGETEAPAPQTGKPDDEDDPKEKDE